ncbi:MAG: F0F1 ATP synthase subunit B [Defluviitaleaceae bacterium]|nr:F0F1 ATP synthase subunit B [Defluviitaleaceae bacterium]
MLKNLLTAINPVRLTAGSGADLAEYDRVLGLDINTLYDIIFIWINVIVIILVLSWLLYKPVRKFLNDRKDRIAGELAKAAEDMQVANDARAEYEGKMLAISGEREDILDAARKLAGEKEVAIIASANDEARLIMERAKTEIEREREKARDEVRTQIVQVSAMMAEKLIGGGMDEATKSRILDDAIAELGDAVWTK